MTPEERIARELARVRKGGAEKYHQKNAEAGEALRPGAAAAAARRGLLRRGRRARQRPRPGAARRRRGHRARHHRRPAGGGHGQRLHRQGRQLGRPHGGEDHPHPGGGRARSGCRSSTWSTRPGRASPTRSRCSRAGAAPGASSTTRSTSPGVVPQICLLFGPSAAGGAYIPAFCDVVFMVEGNASMYLGSPRMAEMVIGEKVIARGDGRRAHALLGLRLRRRPRARPRRRPSARRAATSPSSRGASASCRPAAPPRPPRVDPASASRRSSRSTRTGPSTCCSSSRRWSTRAASSR